MSKKSKTALAFIISVVLIVSLNLNTFAQSFTHSFYDGTFIFEVWNPDKVQIKTFTYRDGKPASSDFDTYIDCLQTTSSYGPSTRIYLKNSIFDLVSPITNLKFISSPSFNLMSGATYEFSCFFACLASIDSLFSYDINLRITPLNSEDVIVIPLANGSIYGDYIKEINTSFTLPVLDSASTYVIRYDVYDFATQSNYNVHMRLDFGDIKLKMYNPVDDAFGNVIYPATSEQIDDLNNKYEDVMNELPDVSTDDVENVLDYDFSEFNNGLNFVRELFERTMNTFNFNLVLAFALCIGFVTYVLGRKVG